MKKLLAMVLVCMMAFAGAAFAETLKMGTNAAFPPYEYYVISIAVMNRTQK